MHGFACHAVAGYKSRMLSPLTDRFAVAPQLTPDDLAGLVAAGYGTVVNNRPDSEVPTDLSDGAMAAAARAAGLAYHAIPVGHGGFDRSMIDALAGVLADGPGKTVAYCRSGSRSAHLWALAEASRGGDPGTLVAAAAAGGYDIGGLLPMLRRLAPA